MKRLWLLAWLMGGLLFPLNGGAEEQTAASVDTTAQMRDDYIQASLLVVSPASEVYSVCGHIALRLLCPSQKMDYCFTFETSTDTQGLVRFLSGKAKGGFIASLTTNYLEAYRQAGRGITEYQLNLLPAEKLELWMHVDQEIMKGFCYRYDYLHTQCTSMCINLIHRVLTERIDYRNQSALLSGTFRDRMLVDAKPYPWTAFFWQTVMGLEGDCSLPFEHKLSPQQLPAVWQEATVSPQNQHLIDSDGTTLVERKTKLSGGVAERMGSPTVIFTLLFIIVVVVTLLQLCIQQSASRRVTPVISISANAIDILLLVAHTLLSVALLWFVLASLPRGASWNWYLLPFNPLPLLLCLMFPSWKTACLKVFLGVLVLVLVLTPFVPQLDLPHALIIGSLSVRLFMKIKETN